LVINVTGQGPRRYAAPLKKHLKWGGSIRE
jgi:hypothetical protein